VSHRILLVDDDVRVTQALRRTLHAAVPWDVSTANSARDALAMLEREAFDVVISDERMPEQSGSELLREVRRRWPDTTRIILTGEASLESTIRAINDAEIYRFLMKPCRTEELVACIEASFRAKGAVNPAMAPVPANGMLTQNFERAVAGLWVAFQPIVSSSGNRVFGYEALMRSEDPVLRSPLDLLAAAEQLDRTAELDHHVLQLVARCAPEAPPDTLLFVNLHPATIVDPFLYNDENALTPIASRIVLELTERSSIENFPNVEEKIAALRELGFRLAVDDLGTGYSGLTCLVRFKPEFVKYDRELVDGIHASNTRTKLVSTLEQLCREIGIRTIAEGIENEVDRDALVSLGCDLLQGYLFGKPHKGFIAAESIRSKPVAAA
jgi:EAL domain-containing protein (putative c-di-GMP-specific phosphodiesterase class I)